TVSSTSNETQPEVDAVLAIDEDDCGTIYAHKNLLAAGSAYFRKLFYGSKLEAAANETANMAGGGE
ncbi:unnamed protein product, partial [Amoebophrya sp. A25]